MRLVVNAVMYAQSGNIYAPVSSRNMEGLFNHHINSNLFVHVCASNRAVVLVVH